MSLTPTDDAQLEAEEKELDQLDEQQTGADTEGDGTTQDSQPPAKRGRGRPKGSKNKNSAANAAPAVPTIPRKRGRPPKEKKEDPAEGSAPKRKRGRPPKNPKPEGEGESSEPPVKRKRGRPPSKKTAESS